MRSILFLPFLLTSSFCYSQVYKDIKAPVDQLQL
jgi:hypothetical protein